MKIMSWNLNHRIQMKKIPPGVISVIGYIDPDLIALNEYVDGNERSSFKEELKKLGFKYISVSQKIKRQNQILIASKGHHKKGDISPPNYDESAITNFLHIIFSEQNLEVVGLRPPAYKKPAELKDYWKEL
ncbi:MAG: endonuclease/exonuclease/phosphatase family protein [Desulfobacterales bacterium]|nr:endonuclease/exonuclease/phosphatase family protein [Desulfobacterales bacterium]